MASFVRFYDSNLNLVNISMEEMRKMINEESKKNLIAEYIYQRFYTRYLKIFDFKCSDTAYYHKAEGVLERNIFQEEYKNGFAMMACGALAIETLAGFLSGNDKTPKYKSNEMFKRVFELAEKHGNDLKVFKDKAYYNSIRCGLLHQGETYEKFKIVRSGPLLDGERINATKFLIELNKLLYDYRDKELILGDWKGLTWASCRNKVTYIITNAMD